MRSHKLAIVFLLLIGVGGLSATIVLFRKWSLRAGPAEKVKHDLREIYKEARVFRQDTGHWPRDVREIMSHLLGPGGSEPRDPWGNYYSLREIDGEFSVTCFGRDKKPGGSDEDGDVVYTGREHIVR